MALIPPIDDAYINEIIKSAGPYNPALNKTQGVKLRELFKLMRDRFEQQVAEEGEGDLQSVTNLGNTTTNGISITGEDNIDIRAQGLNIVSVPGDGNRTTFITTNEGTPESPTYTNELRLDASYYSGTSFRLNNTDVLHIQDPLHFDGIGMVTGYRVKGVDAVNADEFVTLRQLPTPISLTTLGTSGAATFNGTTLNIPQYSGGGSSQDLQSVTDIGFSTNHPLLITGNNFEGDYSQKGLYIHTEFGDGGGSANFSYRYGSIGDYDDYGSTTITLNNQYYSTTEEGENYGSGSIDFHVTGSQAFKVLDRYNTTNASYNSGGVSGYFNGRVIGSEAIYDNEFVTKSQLDSSSGGSQDLQSVTEIGNTTNLGITINGNIDEGNPTGLTLETYAGDGIMYSILTTRYNDDYHAELVADSSYGFDFRARGIHIANLSTPDTALGIAATFNGRVKGVEAINTDEFVTLNQLSSLTTRQQIDVTYAQLISLIGASGLDISKDYRLTDFQSRYNDYKTTNFTGDSVSYPGTTYQGAIEHLIVTPASTNTLKAIARSEEYPDDDIYYVTNNYSQNIWNSDKGTIVRRVDPINGNDMTFDYRTLQYIDGSNIRCMAVGYDDPQKVILNAVGQYGDLKPVAVVNQLYNVNIKELLGDFIIGTLTSVTAELWASKTPNLWITSSEFGTIQLSNLDGSVSVADYHAEKNTSINDSAFSGLTYNSQPYTRIIRGPLYQGVASQWLQRIVMTGSTGTWTSTLL